MDFRTIIVEREHNIVTVVLNRPDRLNAINEELIQELLSAIEILYRDETVRVLIITGAGRAFSAGGDFKSDEHSLKLMDEGPAVFHRGYRNSVAPLINTLQNMRFPTIAMLNGVAVGLGFDIALACDMRIGSEDARFRVAWTKLGLVPAGGGTWLLPRIVGIAKAAELIFSARLIDAKEAEKIGILNKMVPSSALREETIQLARSIAENPPRAISLAKLNLYNGLKTDLASALELLGACQGVLASTEDFKEAVAAFREKRTPTFKGK